jgi:hypothetical protein
MSACASASLKQSIGVPAYFEPGPEWVRMERAYPTLGMVIVNPINGPGDSPNAAFAEQVRGSQAKGLVVLGYVDTDYGRRDLGAVKADVDRYHHWYGLNSIFFDQVASDCSMQPYYAGLHALVKSRDVTATTVLNPGTETSECYMAVAEVIVTFEGRYTTYTARPADPRWVRQYEPSRFWHLVYDAPTIEDMKRAVRLSKDRRVGWIYVTHEAPPPGATANFWHLLPAGTYWEEELGSVL